MNWAQDVCDFHLSAWVGVQHVLVFAKSHLPVKMTWKLHLTATCSNIAEMLQCSIERTHVVFPDTFCQSLHHLLTPNAPSFFVKSSAVFIRENFLRFAGLQFEVGDDCLQVSPNVCDDWNRGVYYDSLSSARITTEVIGVIWSSWNTWEESPIFDFEVMFLLERFQSYLLNTSRCISVSI